MRLAPRHELAILHERGFDQLIEDVVDRVSDEPRVEHERVAIRFLQTTDVAHGPASAPGDRRGRRRGEMRGEQVVGTAAPSCDPRQGSELAVIERQELGYERADAPHPVVPRGRRRASQHRVTVSPPGEVQLLEDRSAKGLPQRAEAINGGAESPVRSPWSTA